MNWILWLRKKQHLHNPSDQRLMFYVHSDLHRIDNKLFVLVHSASADVFMRWIIQCRSTRAMICTFLYVGSVGFPLELFTAVESGESAGGTKSSPCVRHYGSVSKGVFWLTKRRFQFQMGFWRGGWKEEETNLRRASHHFLPLLRLLISSLPLSLSPLSLSCQPFQKASIFSHQTVGACCHVAMLPECQAECQSDGRVWMCNKIWSFFWWWESWKGKKGKHKYWGHH